jgi:hypothetical protein
MSVNKLIAAAALPAMVASPVVAANPASSLSLRGDSSETATSVDEAQAPAAPAATAVGAGMSSTALLLGGLAVVLVVVGAVALGSGHHGSSPASA